MKRRILTLIAAITLSFNVFAQKEITKLEQLPVTAQTFVKTYFNDYHISYVFYDKEFAEIDYKVRFENGIEIEFNHKGEWTNIDSDNKNCIPKDFLLKDINSYIETYHKELCVTEVERERNRIKVELSNNLELKFNNKGKFLSYDN